MQFHHISIKTADIFRSISFYEALGFAVTTRFTAGTTLACWLTGHGMNLELIQVPQPSDPIDSFSDENYVGYYHLSFLVDNLEMCLQNLLTAWGEVQLPLSPRQQTIGETAYLVAFLRDPDGQPIELLQVL
jgi:catechol 2,3-dioxygenase-like lactoylglutathione lyase family enzyme